MLCEGRPWRGWIGSYISILTLCSALSGRRGRVTNSGTVWQSRGNHVELAWLPRGNDTERGESPRAGSGPCCGLWFYSLVLLVLLPHSAIHNSRSMSTSSPPDTHSSLFHTSAVLSSPTLTAHWTHHDQDDGEVDILRISTYPSTATQCSPLESSSPRINPFHLLSHPDSPSSLPPLPPNLQNLAADLGNSNSRLPPVHITKVSANEVEIKSHSPESSNHRNIIGKIGAVFKKDTNELDTGFAPSPVIMQGPPPSPPLSEAGLDESVVMSENTDETPVYHSTAAPVSENRPTIATGFTSEPSEISPAVLTPPIPFSARRVSSSSTSSRAGSLTLVRSGRLAPQRDGESTGKGKDLPALPHESDARLERRDSAGSLLSPTPQLCRRSTVGSLNLPSAPRSPLINAHAAFASPSSTPPPPGAPNVKGDRLDSAILAQEEHIRRERIERLERRQKKASVTSDSEPEPRTEEKPKEKPKEKEREEAKVLVGNLIGEDHVNYVLMYNMLTGIRIGVSQAFGRFIANCSGITLSSQNKASDHGR